MLRIIKIALAGLLALIVCLGLLWVTNLGGFKTGIYVNQIVKMRVSVDNALWFCRGIGRCFC